MVSLKVGLDCTMGCARAAGRQKKSVYGKEVK